MKKSRVILFLIILISGFNCQNDKNLNNQVKTTNEILFCDALSDPENYKAKVIQTKAIIRGYHGFILYSEDCCNIDQVVNAQGIDFEGRRKLFEKISKIYPEWNKSDVKGEITVLGVLEDNDIKPAYSFERMPRYKFTISQVVDYQPNQELTDSCLLRMTGSVVEKK